MLLESLTERELEILRLIADGLSNREIGERLHISTETVKWYNKRAYAKLDVGSRTQAVASARELGLLQEPTSPASVTPAEAAPPRRHNLPVQLTSFVGRQGEMEAVESLLQKNRLLTLTGSGGTGKTRLALEVARRALPHYRDGVTFVGLAPLDDPALVLDTVAQTLDLNEQPGEALPDSLQRFLARRQLLLLLDNFEHLLSVAAKVGDLLAAAPQLTVLVTSREPLRLSGEQEYPVAPLQLPPAEDELIDAAEQAPAVQLFVERARAARPALQFDEQNLLAARRICALLDGLPLAIELAAARTRLFSPQALLARLKQPNETNAAPTLQLLSGGARDLPERQQTLRATIDWSYHLLTAEEQALFRRLAVFAGGCTLEAVETVCGADSEGAEELIDMLSSLVDKNLLRVEDGPEGEPRFWMLHVIREYARERLQRSREAQEVGERHAYTYLNLAEKAEPTLTGPEQATWLSRLESEHDNLRAALRWARRSGEAELGLKLASALWRFWLYRGHLREGRLWLEEMLAVDAAAPAPLRARALYGVGEVAHYQRDLVAARHAHESSLDLRREAGEAAGIADSLVMLGLVDLELGDYAQAEAPMAESLALARKLGDQSRTAYALTGLALKAISQGNQEEARSMLEETLALMRAQQDQVGIWSALNNLGVVALYQRDYARAQQLFERGLDIARPLNTSLFYATTQANMGLVAARLGRVTRATTVLVSALQTFLELEDRLRIAECLEGLAIVAVTRQQSERAVTLWGATAALRETLRAPLSPVERSEQERAEPELRSRLAAGAFERAREEGRRLALDDFGGLIAFALGSVDIST